MLSTRFLLAGGLLYAWARRRGEVAAERPGRRQWRAAALVGLLLLVVDTGGVALAERRVPSGVAALVIASVPLFMAVFDRVCLRPAAPARRDRRDWRPASLGVGILVGPSGKIDTLGAVLLLLAALAWAAGSIVCPRRSAAARARSSPPRCRCCAAASCSRSWGSRRERCPTSTCAPSRPASLAALAFLVVAGSLAFTAYGWLLRNASRPLLSTYAYVNPAWRSFARLGPRRRARRRHREIAAGLVILSSVAMLSLAREPRAEPSRRRSRCPPTFAAGAAGRALPRRAATRSSCA